MKFVKPALSLDQQVELLVSRGMEGDRKRIRRRPRDPEWDAPVKVTNDRAFAVLTILAHCLRHIAPGSGWARRFEALLVKYPGIPTSQMGIPVNWRDCPVWQRMLE